MTLVSNRRLQDIGVKCLAVFFVLFCGGICAVGFYVNIRGGSHFVAFLAGISLLFVLVLASVVWRNDNAASATTQENVPIVEPEMTIVDMSTIEKIREHVLWDVNWNLNELLKKVAGPRQVRESQDCSWFIRTAASLRLSYLEPKILWWNTIKQAIESDKSEQALPALDRLVKHCRPGLFYLTWIAPLSRAYWEMGMGPIAKGVVADKIEEAMVLRRHYQKQLA